MFWGLGNSAEILIYDVTPQMKYIQLSSEASEPQGHGRASVGTGWTDLKNPSN